MDLQLQRIRKACGKGQKDMADQLGVKIRTYGSWERGEVTMSFPQAIACAEVLGCSLDQLAGREWNGSQYSDERQERLNDNYESVTAAGKTRIVEHSDDIAGNPTYSLEPGRAQGDPLPAQEVA